MRRSGIIRCFASHQPSERCALVLDAAIVRTEAAPRRPFQGWRYLDPADSPRDLPKGRALDDKLPPSLAQALAEIGLR